MELVKKDISGYDLTRPSIEEIAKNTERTKQSLEQTLNGTIIAAKVGGEPLRKAQDPYYVKHKGLDGQERIIRMHEQQTDPMECVKFSHRRVPRGQVDDHVRIERSPPRQITSKDQKDWKIPPCISNWKNSKGYTIPIEMRLSADGRYLRDTTISERFPKHSETLYQAERNAREEVSAREAIQKKLALKESLKKENQMRELAAQARAERNSLVKNEQPKKRERSSSVEEREKIRFERSREIERDRRIEHAGRKVQKRDREIERDISEKIALGQAQPTKSKLLDERLFNQNEGVDAGFGSEDEYNVYDKPLFNDRSGANIYRNIRGDKEESDVALPKGRSNPVQFERVREE